jgi:hypothetical protein
MPATYIQAEGVLVLDSESIGHESGEPVATGGDLSY